MTSKNEKNINTYLFLAYEPGKWVSLTVHLSIAPRNTLVPLKTLDDF